MSEHKQKWRLSAINTIYEAYTAKRDMLEKSKKSQSGKGTAKISTGDILEILKEQIVNTVEVAVYPEEKWETTQTNIDRTFVFNADTLFWESSSFLFEAVMTKTMPTHAQSDTIKLANVVFQYCCELHKEVPKPYTGSRYVLFSNGIYDAKQKLLIDMTPKIEEINEVELLTFNRNKLVVDDEECYIPRVGFTPKHLHNMDLDLNAPEPEYVGTHNDVWKPSEWLIRTMGSIEKVNYLLKVMGAMLVPNHSFNAFVEINGQSNSGKTTLIGLIGSIYNNQKSVLQGYTLDDLNDTFPFRGMVDETTSFVHITETNGAGLKSNTISLVNSFANNMLQMKQMGSHSITLTPPPMLVLEGKGWLLFDSVKTGIARRLLPIDITNASTKGYSSQRYGRSVFRQKKVLAYMARIIMLAYAELTQGDDNFTFNIDDTDNLPTFARAWHHEAVNAGDEVMNSFVENIISPNIHNGHVSMKLLFILYCSYVEWANPNEKYPRKYKSFKEVLPIYLQIDFDVKQIHEQMLIKNKSELAIDLDKVGESMPMPDALSMRYDKSDYGRYPQSDMLEISQKVN